MKIINSQAKFDYELKDRLEVGIVLSGPEVKSVKAGQVDMSHASVRIQGTGHHGQHEAWLLNLHIYPYKHADNAKYDPAHSRKLLLHQQEIVSLLSKMKQARLLLVPTAMYTKSNMIKVELALARGKRKYEKRESIKKRDQSREEKQNLL